MANEITITGGLSASKGGAVIATGTKTKLITMTGDDIYCATQAVGTSHEALTIPAEIGTIGRLFIFNMDATNFITVAIGADMTNTFAKIRAGEFISLQPYTATTGPALRVLADTASVNIMVAATEL